MQGLPEPRKMRRMMALLARFGGFPKIRVPFLGVPIIRTIVFWDLYWGYHYCGILPFRCTFGGSGESLG